MLASGRETNESGEDDMRLRRTLIGVGAAVVLALAPAATASPYNEQCGDGTPQGCVTHCIAFHGGITNLHNCLWAHYLV
jgi:hypothetical protein